MTTQEQIENYREWDRRRDLASTRVDSGQYGYTDPQIEDEFLSLASIDDELAVLTVEYKLTVKQIEAIR